MSLPCSPCVTFMISEFLSETILQENPYPQGISAPRLWKEKR
jgi:hypothetical protein